MVLVHCRFFITRDQARLEARSAKRRRQVDHLFDLWDVNGSGILDTAEIKIVLNKWRADAANKFKEGNHCKYQITL